MRSTHRPVASSTVAIAAAVIAAILGVVLGMVAAGDNVLPGDVPVADAVQQLDGRMFEILARIGNTIGSTLWAAAAILLMIAVAAMWRAWPEVIYLVTLLVLRLLGTLLKPVFNSPRPTDDLVLITGTHDGTGYPSGHAFTAATMALGLAVLAWRHIPSRAMAMVAFLTGLTVLIGWARIWTGAHWPSDVLGGFAFGVAVVAVGVVVLNRVSHTQP
ncbi:MAG TPA: phosphatase PAP2 family protein [Thermomicrobiales bacterium]|nr:phosphatase PAP2 family protein [Thermomicrobiales bacterium]